MKFVLATTSRYWWPVVVRRPDPDLERAGQIIEERFRALLEPPPQDEALDIQARIAAMRDPIQRAREERDALAAVCKGWDSDVTDASGAPVPFSAPALQAALQQVWFRTGLYQAYAESLSGEAARLGN